MTWRLKYIDIAKGIAVMLVIFGHTFRESMRQAYVWCDFSYNYVYRFHVSLLFLISGMGYALTRKKNQDEGCLAYLKKKGHSLLLPWFTYAVLIYGVFALVQLYPAIRTLLSGSSYALLSPWQYLIQMLRNENPYCFHIWYLFTLFCYVMLFYLADKWLPKRWMRAVTIGLIGISPLLYETFFSTVCWSLKGFMQKLVFFLLGTLLTDAFLKKYAKRLLALLLPCAVLLGWMQLSTVYVRGYEIRGLGMLLTYVDTAVVMGLCLGILGFCVVCERHFSRLASFGRHTMPYYLYHQPFCCAFLGMLLYDTLHLSAGVTVILCMMAGLIIPYVFIRLIRMMKLEKLFEKVGLPT